MLKQWLQQWDSDNIITWRLSLTRQTLVGTGNVLGLVCTYALGVDPGAHVLRVQALIEHAPIGHDNPQHVGIDRRINEAGVEGQVHPPLSNGCHRARSTAVDPCVRWGGAIPWESSWRFRWLRPWWLITEYFDVESELKLACSSLRSECIFLYSDFMSNLCPGLLSISASSIPSNGWH